MGKVSHSILAIMASSPAVRTAVKRPGAGVTIDSARLIRMRESKPLSRADLAAAMSADGLFSITPDAIAKIENGHRRPKPVTLGRLCAALGCQPEDLLPEPESGKPRPCQDCQGVYGHESGCPQAT